MAAARPVAVGAATRRLTGLWVGTALQLALLASLPAALVLMAGGLVTAEVLFAMDAVGVALRWAIVIVPATLVLVEGLRRLVSRVDDSAVGVPLAEPDQPRLWALVGRLAEVAATRPPDEIYLTADANASVLEETRLVGLIGGRRRMFVGAPLVAGLSGAELAAVLTHELAHFGNRDTRLSGQAYRSRRAFVGTVSALDRTDLFERMLAALLTGYLKVCTRASAGLSRRQERSADEAAAGAVGSVAAAAALRAIPPIQQTWRLFTDHHLALGWDEGYLPADVMGGYAEFRAALDADPDAARPPAAAATPYDTHPPLPARVAAVEALHTAAAVDLAAGPAVDLLDAPAPVLDAAVLSGLVPEARGKARVDWTTLATVCGRAAARSAAAELGTAARALGREPTLRTLLAALDAGRLADLSSSGLDPRRARTLGARARRELARQAVRPALAAAVQSALAEAGFGRWELVWPSALRFAAAEPHAGTVADLVDAALGDVADTSGLRRLLSDADLDRNLTAT